MNGLSFYQNVIYHFEFWIATYVAVQSNDAVVRLFA